MIIKLNKAILHICNVCSGSLINSDDELDVTQGAISDYIMSHIERVFANPAITKGKFTTDPELCKSEFYFCEYIAIYFRPNVFRIYVMQKTDRF